MRPAAIDLAGTPGEQEVFLAWGAASNAIAYRVYRDDTQVARTAATSFTDTKLTDGASYDYYVVAYRTATHISAESSTVAVTPRDTTPPTSRGNLYGTAGDTQVSLSWSAATDNVGVTGYDVYRNGTQVAQTVNTSYTDTGLTDGTSYSYDVTAHDAAGNLSPPSTSVSATPIAPVAPVAPLTNWDPSGQPMPVGDIPGWRQVFADNFANDSVPLGSFSGCSWPSDATVMQINCSGVSSDPTVEAKWFAYPDGWTDSLNGTYYPSRVMSIANGVMNYNLHTETVAGTAYHMTSAATPKIPDGDGTAGGQLYGRYVIRARWDSLRGYHVAFLLWPDSDNWPSGGEIDFPDDALNSTTLDAFLHWEGATGPAFAHWGIPGSGQQWHTYEIDWTASALSFYVDGKLIGQSTSNIPVTPMHWVLQTDTWSGEAAPSDTTAGNVQIDWATAYTPG